MRCTAARGPNWRCLSFRLSAHKSAELQLSRWTDARVLDLDVQRRRNCDHAGFEVAVTVLWRELRLTYYDHRHWDTARGAFEEAQ